LAERRPNALSGSGHKLWSTESHGHAQTITGALGDGQDIWKRADQGNASAYLYWQWSEDAADGQHSLMIDGSRHQVLTSPSTSTATSVPARCASARRAATTRLRSLSFKQPDNGAVTHVLFNANASQADVTLNLSGSGLPHDVQGLPHQRHGKPRAAGEHHGQRQRRSRSRCRPTASSRSTAARTSTTRTSTSGGSLPAKQTSPTARSPTRCASPPPRATPATCAS
jgi:hypothetical protein